MQNYRVVLKAEASKSFRAKKACDSVDLNIDEKLTHDLSVDIDIESDFNIGLICGNSGSGKTTLAKKIFGEEIFSNTKNLDFNKAIIDQLPESMSYEECAKILASVGLTSIPCWIKPVKYLSNGQQFRAEIAFKLCQDDEYIVIDEFTSVVDRTVAKGISLNIQKIIKQTNKKVILLSCHFDIIEWLNPDWVLDLNTLTFENWRLLRGIRTEKLRFDIKEGGEENWKNLGKYHYLSHKIPGGKRTCYTLFESNKCVGIVFFSNYTPKRKNRNFIMHFNRLVIHPDYQGFGLGLKFLNICSEHMTKLGYDVRGVFSSKSMVKNCLRDPNWKFQGAKTKSNYTITSMRRSGSIRLDVKMYSFKYSKA